MLVRRMLCEKQLVLLVVLFILSVTRVAAGADEDAIRKHFKTAVDSMGTGDYEECERALNKVLELKPTSSLALELREMAGYRFFIKLLSRKPLDVLAREFLSLAEKRTLERNTDPDYIRGLIKDLKGDFETRWYAKMRLEAEVGQYAVPYLIDLVREGTNELSTFCRIVLRGIEEESVPALLACLDSTDTELIEAVVLILGQIGDDRAIPDLALIHQDPETKVELKMLVGRALKRIMGRDAGELAPAKELFFDKAEKYYYRHHSVMKESRMIGYVLWKWSEAKNGLVWQEAPPSVYYGELAELACYGCFAIDVDYEPSYDLLAAVYFAQLDAATRVIAAADAGDDKHNDIIQRNMEYLKLRKMDLQRKACLVAKALGAVPLYRCLNRALKDGDVVVATMAMRRLAEVANGTLLPSWGDEGSPNEGSVPEGEIQDDGNIGGAEGAPILRALSSPDKRIRYVAAETLIAMNPQKPFLHRERVVPALCQALGEKAVWFVMLVDADAKRTNKFKSLFVSDEFTMLAIPSTAYARAKAMEFPAPDLILIATDLPDHGAKKLVSKLKIDFRTASIPIFVLTTPEKRVVDEKVFADNVERIIVLKEELLVTVGAAKDEFRQRSEGNIKSESEAVALRAAKSIASIDPNSTHLTPLDALDVLIKSASERSDEIKKPCIVALGRLGRPEASTALSSLFENKDNDAKVRLLAGEALGCCNPKAAYSVLKDALNEEDDSIRQWAASALGKVGLHGEELKKILLDQRIGPVLEKTGASTGK